MDEAPYFTYENYSVPEHDAFHPAMPDRELEQALYGQIRPSQIVIILARMYVPSRYWIQKEIDIALELRKPIIGIVPWGAERTPVEVQEIVNEMVNWNTSSIVGAVKRNVP